MEESLRTVHVEPEIWGPGLWAIGLDSVYLALEDRVFAQHSRAVLQLLGTCAACNACRRFYNRFLYHNPVPYEPVNQYLWFVTARNVVNGKLGKPSPSYATATRMALLNNGSTMCDYSKHKAWLMCLEASMYCSETGPVRRTALLLLQRRLQEMFPDAWGLDKLREVAGECKETNYLALGDASIACRRILGRQ